MIKVKQFKTWLDTTNYSAKTKEAYLGAINHYSKYFKDTEMVSVLAYKAMLCERNAPQTVNLRLRAINCYNEWMGDKAWGILIFMERAASCAGFIFLNTSRKRLRTGFLGISNISQTGYFSNGSGNHRVKVEGLRREI